MAFGFRPLNGLIRRSSALPDAMLYSFCKKISGHIHQVKWLELECKSRCQIKLAEIQIMFRFNSFMDLSQRKKKSHPTDVKYKMLDLLVCLLSGLTLKEHQPENRENFKTNLISLQMEELFHVNLTHRNFSYERRRLPFVLTARQTNKW